MGLFGGGNSSATTNNISTSTTNNNYRDNQLAVQNGVGISGDGNSYTSNSWADNSLKMTVNDSSNRSTTNTTYVTDMGAMKIAGDIATNAVNKLSGSTDTLARFMAEGQKNALDYGFKLTNNALDAVGASQHITTDLMKKNSDLAGLAVQKVQDAYKTAGDAASGKTLGDFKYIAIGLVVVLGFLAWKRKA